jgi:cell division protein ZapA
MNRVDVQIFGQSYTIVGNDDPDRVQELARLVDTKMREIAEHSKGISPLKIAILTALNIGDDMLSAREGQDAFAQKGDKLISLLSGVIED